MFVNGSIRGPLFYEMLAGVPRVQADSLSVIRDRYVSGDVEPLRRHALRLPEELAAALEQAIAADPEERFASVGAFRNAITTALPGNAAADREEDDRPYGHHVPASLHQGPPSVATTLGETPLDDASGPRSSTAASAPRGKTCSAAVSSRRSRPRYTFQRAAPAVAAGGRCGLLVGAVPS